MRRAGGGWWAWGAGRRRTASAPCLCGEQRQDGFLAPATGAAGGVRDVFVRLRMSSRSGTGARTGT